MAAKAILAWFGGSPAVWTTSMLFFQTLLLAGYGYAHLIVMRLTPRGQARVHLALLAATLLVLPLSVDPRWKPSGLEDPVPRIIGVFATSVGLPYLALSTTGPLLQAWAAAEERSPYRLYALSNAGSLAALLSYPVLVEPLLTTGQQFAVWSVAYAAFALLTALAALRIRRRVRAPLREATASSGRPARVRVALWAALPACASVLLLAVTNQICQEVAVVPFLWLLPLTLYLVSFILCFEGDRWYRRAVFLPALPVLSGTAAYVVLGGTTIGLPIALGTFTAYLFVACMVCHGELVCLRPGRDRLTQFYMMVSLGGALGGAFVALAAPRIFRLYFELHLGIVSCLVLAAIAVIAQSPAGFRAARWRWLVWFEITLALTALLWMPGGAPGSIVRASGRNFYGVLRVVEFKRRDETVVRRHLIHGNTNHGFQFLSPERRHEAVSYYGPHSGVGALLTGFHPDTPRRVGTLGLGTGTIAAFGRPGDTFRFFEINPLVVQFARSEFTFLDDCRAKVEIVVADARLALEREQGERYDILIADAFSSDAVPVHLLTEEAFRLYFRRLAPDGVLAVNISNRVLDLRPVVAGAAAALGVEAVFVDSDASRSAGWFKALWVLLSANAETLRSLSFEAPGSRTVPGPAQRILWRDDHSNLFQILK